MLETKQELAARLQVSVKTIDRWLKNPTLGLKKHKIGKIVRIDASGLTIPVEEPEGERDEYVSSGSVYC